MIATSRAAAELAHEAIARARLHADDLAGRDRLADDGRRAAGQLPQPLDAHAHVRVVDVAAEHGLVMAQRALVILAAARVLGEQVVRAQRERVVTDEQLEVRQRRVELAALFVALGEQRAHARGALRGHLGHAEQLLHPFDREQLVARRPDAVESRDHLGRGDLVAALAIAEILHELREEHFVFAAEGLRLHGRRG